MLNRRFLRIKVMQALYAYFQQEKGDIVVQEKELYKSLDRIYDLYVYILALLQDIHHTAHLVIEENKNKRLPTPEDLNPNLKFVENPVLVAISESAYLRKEVANRKISWQNDLDLVRKLYNEIRNSQAYKTYMAQPKGNMQEDKTFISWIVSDLLAEHELLNYLFEDKNIHWADDNFVAFTMVLRTLEGTENELKLLPLYKDAEDDKQFVSTLFRKTIVNNEEYGELIQSKTKNWEIERIAAMDVLLMKMAITEFMHVSNVPVKVSLNEYIDISKEYSTPNSKTFINGVLDKIIVDLKNQDKIRKTGRGLVEN